MSKNNKQVTFHIVRHGKTLFNEMGRIQGWSDSQLSPMGIKETHESGKGMKNIDFKKVYSSDLGRAVQTTDLLLSHNKNRDVDIIYDPRIREVSFGMFEGDFGDNTRKWTAEKRGYSCLDTFMEEEFDWITMLNLISEHDDFQVAENSDEVSERIESFLKEVAQKEYDNGGGDILIVSHGMTINFIIYYLLNTTDTIFIPNVSRTKVIYDGSEFSLRDIGDTSHFVK